MGKRVVFKQHRVGLAASSSFARFWFLALATGMVVQSLALGGKPLPPSPPPCAPDGACYPKRDTWGYNVTRWRAWPGEDPVVPTPVDVLPPDEEIPLRPLERPDPRDEDLRGPRRPAPAIRAVPVDPTMPMDWPSRAMKSTPRTALISR